MKICFICNTKIWEWETNVILEPIGSESADEWVDAHDECYKNAKDKLKDYRQRGFGIKF